jgi:hypothetical protein
MFFFLRRFFNDPIRMIYVAGLEIFFYVILAVCAAVIIYTNRSISVYIIGGCVESFVGYLIFTEIRDQDAENEEVIYESEIKTSVT